ncbi:MAG: hypothetical protein Q9196_004216 [Gyalolechia fulgens]
MPVSHAHIALPYRFLFLYLEPAAAFFGSYITLAAPAAYLSSLSLTAKYSPDTFPVYAQLTGHLLLFSWIQAVVLRATSSVEIWKGLLFGMFLCDLLHFYGSCVGIGRKRIFDLKAWRLEEWVAMVMTVVPAAMRLAFCLEVGVGKEGLIGRLKES